MVKDVVTGSPPIAHRSRFPDEPVLPVAAAAMPMEWSAGISGISGISGIPGLFGLSGLLDLLGLFGLLGLLDLLVLFYNYYCCHLYLLNKRSPCCIRNIYAQRNQSVDTGALLV